MGNSALLKRGTEVLAALVIVIAIAYVSTVTRNDKMTGYHDLAMHMDAIAGSGNLPAGDIMQQPEITLDEAETNAHAAPGNMEEKEPVSLYGINLAEPSEAYGERKAEQSGTPGETSEAVSLQAEQAEESSEKPAAAPVYKFIDADLLNVRSGPSAETEKLASLTEGARVQVLENQGEWTKIITADNIEGYALTKYMVDSLPPVYKYISADKLNVRSGPSAETEKLATLTKGARVQVLEAQGEWTKIITAGNIAGYALTEYMVGSLPPVYKYISADKLNVRSGPSAETEKLATLSYGDRVQVFEQEGDWIRVITKDNVKGYVLSAYVVSEVNPASRSASAGQAYNADLAASVLEYAKQFVGVKYVYGGSTPKGFDCSGFTKYVFQKFKIDLPRSSEDYYGVGTKVSRTDMKPGDVLLFDVYDNNRLGHVGIYMGKDQFIHASTSKGKVVIATLSKYSGNLLGIRRVIK